MIGGFVEFCNKFLTDEISLLSLATIFTFDKHEQSCFLWQFKTFIDFADMADLKL